MTPDLVFLLDVDNTLLDGDRIVVDLHAHVRSELGVAGAQRYWAIFAALRIELGYVDYLGALQRLRNDSELGAVQQHRLLTLSSFLIDYPFADRLYPRALEAIEHLGHFGPTVILTDGDVVLQPRKLQRSGLWDAVDGRAMVCVHKEKVLDAVRRCHPAHHHVMVDDKLRVLTAMKQVWRERLTTVFVHQGHYALDSHPSMADVAPDVTIEHIGELAERDLSALLRRPATSACPSSNPP